MRICKHCHIRIEQEQFGAGLRWVHVRRLGAHPWQEERYQACNLVAPIAEPQGTDT